MSLSMAEQRPGFAAKVAGGDLTRPLNDAAFALYDPFLQACSNAEGSPSCSARLNAPSGWREKSP